jgi:hypothetical protein
MYINELGCFYIIFKKKRRFWGGRGEEIGEGLR